MSSIGPNPPSATGSLHNDWTNPSNAYVLDGLYASKSASGSGIAGTALSSNAGSTWTTGNEFISFGNSNSSFSVGGSTYLWGGTWTPSSFTNANFKISLAKGFVGLGSGNWQDYYNFNIPTIPSNATITGILISGTGYQANPIIYVDQILVTVYYIVASITGVQSTTGIQSITF